MMVANIVAKLALLVVTVIVGIIVVAAKEVNQHSQMRRLTHIAHKYGHFGCKMYLTNEYLRDNIHGEHYDGNIHSSIGILLYIE